VHVSCHDATSSEALCSRRTPPVRRNRRAADHVVEQTCFREVSAYSTVYPEFASGFLRKCNPRCRIRTYLKCAIRMLRWFRKSYCLPLSPHLHAASNPLASGSNSVCRYRTSERPVLRRRVVQSSSTRLRASRSSLPESAAIACLPSLPLSQRGRVDREIQTQNSRSHIAMSYQLSFAWKASLTRTPPPICTSARGSKIALILRAVGAANA
jgi:hypothetical protein